MVVLRSDGLGAGAGGNEATLAADLSDVRPRTRPVGHVGGNETGDPLVGGAEQAELYSLPSADRAARPSLRLSSSLLSPAADSGDQHGRSGEAHEDAPGGAGASSCRTTRSRRHPGLQVPRHARAAPWFCLSVLAGRDRAHRDRGGRRRRRPRLLPEARIFQAGRQYDFGRTLGEGVDECPPPQVAEAGVDVALGVGVVDATPKTSQALALRARIVLGCASGATNKDVAAELRITGATVCKWRRCPGDHGQARWPRAGGGWRYFSGLILTHYPAGAYSGLAF